jgi:hypothetical protein
VVRSQGVGRSGNSVVSRASFEGKQNVEYDHKGASLGADVREYDEVRQPVELLDVRRRQLRAVPVELESFPHGK